MFSWRLFYVWRTALTCSPYRGWFRVLSVMVRRTLAYMKVTYRSWKNLRMRKSKISLSLESVFILLVPIFLGNLLFYSYPKTIWVTLCFVFQKFRFCGCSYWSKRESFLVSLRKCIFTGWYNFHVDRNNLRRQSIQKLRSIFHISINQHSDVLLNNSSLRLALQLTGEAYGVASNHFVRLDFIKAQICSDCALKSLVVTNNNNSDTKSRE